MKLFVLCVLAACSKPAPPAQPVAPSQPAPVTVEPAPAEPAAEAPPPEPAPALAPVTYEPPRGRITVSSKLAHDNTSLEADAVVAKIQRDYIGGLLRCYTNELKMDTDAHGRLTLNFVAASTGRVVKSDATGMQRVDACIASAATTWRFPVPRDDDGEPTEASFTIVFTAVPER